MGQWFDVGLQAGEKVSKEIDAFVDKIHDADNPEESFDPVKRKTLSDGSTIYLWTIQWYKFSCTEKGMEFLRLLKKFSDDNGVDPDDEGCAYKLVAVGEDGSFEERCNYAGSDLFEELRHGLCFPDEWHNGDRS